MIIEEESLMGHVPAAMGFAALVRQNLLFLSAKYESYFSDFLVTVHCGAKVAENNTYFESEGDEKGHCRVAVCKVKPSIVQVLHFGLVSKRWLGCMAPAARKASLYKDSFPS